MHYQVRIISNGEATVYTRRTESTAVSWAESLVSYHQTMVQVISPSGVSTWIFPRD